MNKEWTSRARVETALAHVEPDRVPVDLSITLNTYLRLREFLGLPPEDNVKADRFFEVRPGPDLLEALGIDLTFVRLKGPRNWSPPPARDDGTQLDIWGVGRKLIKLPDGSYLNEVAYNPLGELEPVDIDLDAYPWPDPYDTGYVEGLGNEAKKLFEETNLALMGRFGGPILEIGAYLRGYEQWLIDLVLFPDFARDLLERVTDISIALDEAGIRETGQYLSVFKVSGEDLGMQDRTLFSPKLWKSIIYPVLKRRWKAAREALDKYAPHVKIMLHSDGAIRPFIPDIIEGYIDLLDPVQPICAGMELSGLKRDFGDRLAFHGGVDTQQLLPFGTPAEVEAEVIRCMKSLGPGGGLVLGPSHFFQPDVPPENIVAMYDAAHEHGSYPLP